MGFAVDRAHVVTCAHVVEGFEVGSEVEVRSAASGASFVCRLVGCEWEPEAEGSDLALLRRTDGIPLDPVRLASEPPRGTSCALYGYHTHGSGE